MPENGFIEVEQRLWANRSVGSVAPLQDSPGNECSFAAKLFSRTMEWTVKDIKSNLPILQAQRSDLPWVTQHGIGNDMEESRFLNSRMECVS